MTAKEYLMQIQWQAKAVQRAEDHLKEMRYQAESPRSASYAITRSPLPSNEDHMASNMVRLEQAQNALYKECVKLLMIRNDIIQKLWDMDNKMYGELLLCMYYDLEPLRATAKRMDYSEDYIRNLHGKALKAFAEQYHKELEQDDRG